MYFYEIGWWIVDGHVTINVKFRELCKYLVKIGKYKIYRDALYKMATCSYDKRFQKTLGLYKRNFQFPVMMQIMLIISNSCRN